MRVCVSVHWTVGTGVDAFCLSVHLIRHMTPNQVYAQSEDAATCTHKPAHAHAYAKGDYIRAEIMLEKFILETKDVLGFSSAVGPITSSKTSLG